MPETAFPLALVDSRREDRRPVESRDPATGVVWRSFDAAAEDEVRDAVQLARDSQSDWAALSRRKRAAILRKFRRLLYERRHEVAELIGRENGKPASEALAAEVLVTLDFAATYARLAPRLLRPRRRRAATMTMMLKRVIVEYEPHGVIGVISPWNYPFMLAAGVVLPALVAGNAVVLKPSEFTPSSGELLVDLLHRAGVPQGVLAFLPGDGVTGAALVNAGVDKISFTGSVATGRKVAMECARQLIPCSLELGGSDPALVLDDADVRRAVRGILWGRFSNAGQTCVAPKRVFVADAVYDEFSRILADEVRQLKVGDGTHAGTEVGPMIRPSQAALVREQIHDAVDRGATILARARAPLGEGWVAPILLTDVDPQSRVLTEETFGPVLPLVRVHDDDEAVRLANDSDFGLSASVWSASRRRAVRVARRLHAGTVAINDSTVVAGMANVPHGGVKASGLGRAHGVEGLMECVRTRTIVRDRMKFRRQPWWFRYTERNAKRFDAIVRAAHGSRIRRITSGFGVLRALLTR